MRGTKRCTGMAGTIIEYLDGRAKPAQRRAVEEHLAGCVQCRTRADEFRTLRDALDDLPAISPSPVFDASLRARITAEPAHRGFWGWLPSPRFTLVVTALIVLSVWISSRPRVTSNQAAMGVVSPTEVDFSMIRDLPVLENYDVLSKFDVLSELPGSPPAVPPEKR